MNGRPGHPIPRRRWGIAVLLGVSVLFNYFDRLALSVAGPSLRQELHLDALTLGVLFSAFSWSYAALQIPSGMILDRFGVTRVGRIGIMLWGVASAITALSGGYGGILLARLLLGAAEAPSFPLNSKAVGHWFPRAERSTATAMFDGMAKFSQVVGVPLVAVALVWFGWRGAFWMTAGLSFLFLIVFWICYRDPSEDAHLSPVEHDYILAGGAVPEGQRRRRHCADAGLHPYPPEGVGADAWLRLLRLFQLAVCFVAADLFRADHERQPAEISQLHHAALVHRHRRAVRHRRMAGRSSGAAGS